MHHCYFNGKIEPIQDTFLGINDLGLLRGYGVFDYFRTYNGLPFHFDLNWQRLNNSANILGIEVPITEEEFNNVIDKLKKYSGLNEVAFRVILTGGYAADSVNAFEPNLLINSEDVHSPSESDYENGLKIITKDYVRDLPLAKTTDYKHFMMELKNIKKRNASDVLFYNNGNISELSRANVFIVKNNVLITPQRDVLEGISKKILIDLASHQYKVEIRDVTLEETYKADEVFTTSTTRKLIGITKIDDVIIGDGKPGKVTTDLLNKFTDYTKNWGV